MPDFEERAIKKKLQSCGLPLTLSPNAFGELRASDPTTSRESLTEQMERQGYLFFREMVAPELVTNAQRELAKHLATEGATVPNTNPLDLVAAPGFESDFRSEAGNYPLTYEATRASALKEFFDRFLGAPSRTLDHTWIRIKSPGRSTAPHCDIVYMGRGTHQLYTLWMPLGDIPLELGPLMLLEGSNRLTRLRENYCQMDIDKHRNATRWRFRHGGFFRGGQYTKKPAAAQKELGGRWLTTDFRAGDVVIFTGFTLHGSLDNMTDRIRISADTRYQRSDQPADPRWIK